MYLLLDTYEFSLQCCGLNLVPRTAQYVIFFHFQSKNSSLKSLPTAAVLQWEAAMSFSPSLHPPRNKEKRNCMAGSSLHQFHTCNSPLGQNSKLAKNWWQAENAKWRTVSQESFTCQFRQRSLNSVRDSSFTSAFYFFHFSSSFLHCLKRLLNKQSKHSGAGWKRRSRHNLTGVNKACTR